MSLVRPDEAHSAFVNPMPPTENEIVVEPDDPVDTSPAVSSTRTVELVAYVLLLALAFVLGYDNYRSGMGWASDGPQSGYLPFYLCVILAGSSLWGIGSLVVRPAQARQTFVTRDQLRRVLQVFVPTLIFCVLLQVLGLYIASFLLVAGFMRFIGRIAWWKCLVTSAVFVVAMFLTFDVAFNVIMPKGLIEPLLGR